MLRPYKLGGTSSRDFFFHKMKADPAGTGSAFCLNFFISLLHYFFYAVAAFTCDKAAATSFKSGTTGMS
jgi:hypothetical protein